MQTMMATMPDPSAAARPLRGAARAKLAVAAPVGFVLAASADRHLNRASALAPVTLALVLGFVAAYRLPPNRSLVVIGGAVACTAAWLLGQRDDIGVVLILALLFAIGVGLGVERPAPTRATAISALGGAVALAVLRFVASEPVLIIVLVLIVVAATGIAAFDPPPRRAPSRRIAVAFGTVLVIVTLIFTGYVGAETPDATWFGGGAVHGPTGANEVALTFDDGPNIGATKKIMAILDARGVKGTFFEVGTAIDEEPQITRALYADGQLLGNHSYHHDQWRWLDPGYPELQRTQAAFQRAIGTCPVLYRPPHGDRTPFLAQVVRDHHMHMILWSASAGDWATNDAQLVARRILAGARPGAILLLHDGLDGNPTANRQVLVRALPLILDGLRAKGLSAVRLDRLLGTAAYQDC
jgi:peptidoglycan/xylan/chitin deacetylase (PgdA/CDA1 family)